MSKQLIDNLATVLRQAGYRNLSRQDSSVSSTLTASQGDSRVVVHISEGAPAATAQAVRHSLAPQGLQILARATLPGLAANAPSGADPLAGFRQGAGGGKTASTAATDETIVKLE